MKLSTTIALTAAAAGIVATTALSGCARAPGIYVELGAGYAIEATTSRVLLPDCFEVYEPRVGGWRSCGGDNPTAQLSAGWESLGQRWRIEYMHESHYFDGGKDRETHRDQVRMVRRFGGRDAQTHIDSGVHFDD